MDMEQTEKIRPWLLARMMKDASREAFRRARQQHIENLLLAARNARPPEMVLPAKRHADDLTTNHLAALSEELQEAVKNITPDTRWEARRSNQGGYFVTDGNLYQHSFSQAYCEAVAAFFAGDLLTALQKRDEVNASRPVAP